jgi:hypothetical protein
MIPTRNHEFRIRENLFDGLEGLEHELQPFVRAPFTKCQNAVLRIAPAGEIRVLRPASQDSVRPKVNILTAIFFMKDLAIPRHENGHRIREQEHFCGKGSR